MREDVITGEDSDCNTKAESLSVSFPLYRLIMKGNNHHMSKVKLICTQCGKAFERYKSNIHSEKAFCNIDCKREYEKAIKITRQCKQCGKEFDVNKSAIDNTNASGNFCCRECYHKYLTTITGSKNKSYKRIQKKCPVCGKDVSIIPSKDRIYKNNFCSVECRGIHQKEYIGGKNNPNWRGGASKYRGDFDDVKKMYFSKKQFCAVCGTTSGIHIHHIIPYRLTQDNSRDNLIPLCRKHHKIVEAHSIKFIELFDKDDYETAKYYMNILLRERQYETASALLELKEKRVCG